MEYVQRRSHWPRSPEPNILMANVTKPHKLGTYKNIIYDFYNDTKKGRASYLYLSSICKSGSSAAPGYEKVEKSLK